MKRFSLCAALLLTLSACGGGGAEVSCANDYWDGTYGTCLPADWVVINAETLRQRGVPQGTVTAFQSEIAVSGQFPTVTVTQETLAQEASPQNYSQAAIRSVSSLPNYTQLDSQELTLDDADLTLHEFTAQPLPEEPARRFYQLSTVANGVGYTVTGTTPVAPGEQVEQEIILILSNSTFVEQEEE